MTPDNGAANLPAVASSSSGGGGMDMDDIFSMFGDIFGGHGGGFGGFGGFGGDRGGSQKRVYRGSDLRLKVKLSLPRMAHRFN